MRSSCRFGDVAARPTRARGAREIESARALARAIDKNRGAP